MTYYSIILFALGTFLVLGTIISAIRTLVLPRATRDPVTFLAYKLTGILFSIPVRFARSYQQRDQIMALYAPLTLMLLPGSWLVLVLFGYMFMYWSLGVVPFSEAFYLSGSSLLTLGSDLAETTFIRTLVFTEAAIGLALVALLIAYLPAMYSSFSRREQAVNLLEIRAGSPPSAVEWLIRANRNQWLENLGVQFATWEGWFADLEESHTSFSPLVYFRSPQSDRSWVTASGAVLDTASLMIAVVDVPFDDMDAKLCLRAGYLALRQIADSYGIKYNNNPSFPEQPISISREEFDEACSQLSTADIPLVADLDLAWQDFGGWRVNYDQPLLALAALVKAPYAPWSSDRSLRGLKINSRG